jgi:uncharacterized membrane protein YhaH (DUF805 family)
MLGARMNLLLVVVLVNMGCVVMSEFTNDYSKKTWIFFLFQKIVVPEFFK